MEIPTGTALFPPLPLFPVAITAIKHTSLTKIWCYCGYSGEVIDNFWMYNDRAQLHTYFV